ncbi:MAG: PepSY-associated TM helix domain-containing protein [Polyangiaceae bacterium]|nr:PepSY-associated TM helix domain-containing protein [Polyangiaceae bacterium]
MVLHRDIGYLVTSLLLAYCVSGLALNHADLWNPDFVIQKREVAVPRRDSSADLSKEEVAALDRLVGEAEHRVVDRPTADQVKVYYEGATLHVDYSAGKGLYERVSRRPIIYQVDVLHKNSFKPWRWVSDVLALALIALSLTGLFVLRGPKGLGGRGWRLVALGTAPGVIALALHG